jgi:hypothetical protein
MYFLDKSTFLSSMTRNLESVVVRVSLKANAVSNYFNILTWVNETFVLASNNKEDFIGYAKDLMKYQATLLQYCLADGAKRGIKVAALRNTKATLTALLQKREPDFTEDAVQSYLSIVLGSTLSPFATGVELGLLAGLSKQLENEIAMKLIDQSKATIYDFFIKEVIGSKLRIPHYVMVCPVRSFLTIRANLSAISQDSPLKRTSKEYYAPHSLVAF